MLEQMPKGAPSLHRKETLAMLTLQQSFWDTSFRYFSQLPAILLCVAALGSAIII